MVLGTAKTTRLPQNHRAQTKHQLEHSVNLQYVTDVLVAMLTDGFNNLPHYRVADYRHDVATIKRRVICEGLYFVVKVLPGLSDTVFQMLEGRTASFSGFATRNEIPIFLNGCLTRAINGEPDYVRFVYQLSVAFKKTADAFIGDPKKEEKKMWDQYKTDDSTLLSVDWFNDDNFRVLERARHYCHMTFKDFDVFGNTNIPRPGPGATKSHTPPYMRYLPQKKFLQIDRVIPYKDWFYSRPSKMTDIARTYLSKKVEVEPSSRFKAVPKTALKLRGICIEENEVQFLQQGVRRALTAHIAQHPLYRRRIVLKDQSVNGWMAMESSKSRSFATIDLSNASDLVAREGVSWIFQDNTDLHNALMALSTKYVEPPVGVKDALHKTAKFAPMGSAICFPIMSLYFMFIIRAAISLSKLPNPHLLSTNVFVYGDDLVVPSIAYDVVTSTLQRFGLVVNLTKSYVKSYFRESCGVHAFKGMDVTPVYIRSFPHHKRLSTMRTLIETEHQFHKKGYHCTAEIMRGYGQFHWRKHFSWPLYVTPESSLIGWKRDRNDDPSKRIYYKTVRVKEVMHDSDYQYRLCKGVVLTSRPVNCSLIHGSDALLRWIALKPKDAETGSTLAGDEPRSPVLKTRRRWEPLDYVHNAICPLGDRKYFSSGVRPSAHVGVTVSVSTS